MTFSLNASTTHSVAVPRILSKALRGGLLVCFQPSPRPDGLIASFMAAVANRRETLGPFASTLINRVVQDVALTSEDFRRIAATMREVEAAGVS